MTESNQSLPPMSGSRTSSPQPSTATGGPVPPVPYGHPAAPMHVAPGSGPVGKVRGTGVCILLSVITFGFYNWVWFFKTHSEMKRHSGQGLGGGLALVLTIFIGFVMPYVTASEVSGLYERRGLRKPVSGLTGLWYFPGAFILVGPLVWFVKTNGALNAYWRTLGAV